LLAPALLVGLGVASSSADELPAGTPDVVDVGDECVYAAAPSGQNSNRLRIVLAPGHIYDVSVDDVLVQPNGGGAFDTTDATVNTDFFYDIAVAGATQSNVLAVSHEGALLHTSTVASGDCYQKTTSLTISRNPSQIKRGESVTLTGVLRTTDNAPVAGATVKLERRLSGGSWSSAGSTTSNGSGQVSLSNAPTRDAEYRWVYAGTGRFAGRTSGTAGVIVQQPTTLAISRSTSTLTAGKSATISGRLRTGDGANVKDRPVTLQRRFVGTSSWTTVTSKRTSSTGRVSFTVKPTRHTEYRLRHASTTSFGSSTSSVTKVSVRPAFTLTNSRLTGLLGRTTTLKGTVNPVYSKQKIQLQRLVSGSWRTVETKKPSSSGAYSFSVKPSSTGSRSYRVRIPATDRHLSVTSSTKKIVRYAAKITHIEYDAPGNDRYNLNGEYMVVKNTGSVTINLKDWVVDASPQRRALPSYTLKPGATVRIHTGSGSQASGRIYLGYKAPIWNNDGDTGRLYDPHGSLASKYTY
jgi:hypothetical protein